MLSNRLLLVILIYLSIFIYNASPNIISNTTIIATTTTTTTTSFNTSYYKNNIDNRLSNTSLLTDTAKRLDILPPWNAPSFIWKWAWNLHKFMMPYLHAFDSAKAKDSYVNLAVLWWKAISGNCYGTRLFDKGIAFDLLPSFTRNVVRFPLCFLYPRLHHQNVALRTLYLDELLNSELCIDNSNREILSNTSSIDDTTCTALPLTTTSSSSSSLTNDSYTPTIMNNDKGYHIESSYFDTINITNNVYIDRYPTRYQVITIGAGFDTRSLRFQSKLSPSNPLINFHEIDLPDVIDQKQAMLTRFLSRRNRLTNIFRRTTTYPTQESNITTATTTVDDNTREWRIPQLYKADCNELHQVQQCLDLIMSHNPTTIINNNAKSNNPLPYEKTVFIVEAVLMYLKDENVLPLIDMCMKSASKVSKQVSFCFADRFPISTTTTTNISSDISNNNNNNNNNNKQDSYTACVKEKEDVSNYLKQANLDLNQWLSKPGKARHMGVARLLSSSNNMKRTSMS